MKVLLDENLPHAVRHLLPGHDVYTVKWLGWTSTRNGALLRRAAENGFDVMLTLDNGVPYQQNLETLPIAVVVMSAPVAISRTSGRWCQPCSANCRNWNREPWFESRDRQATGRGRRDRMAAITAFHSTYPTVASAITYWWATMISSTRTSTTISRPIDRRPLEVAV